jgi:hypothetical protein
MCLRTHGATMACVPTLMHTHTLMHHLQIMIASTASCLAAARFGLAPSAKKLAGREGAPLQLTDRKVDLLTNDPAGVSNSLTHTYTLKHAHASRMRASPHRAHPRCAKHSAGARAARAWGCSRRVMHDVAAGASDGLRVQAHTRTPCVMACSCRHTHAHPV